jgi:histone deacetylase 1/2
MSNNITVGSGQNIPIVGCGHASLPNSSHPLKLPNVLHAPKLIKNLIFVRKFTIDNLSVEFDSFGFSVKDFQTGILLMRCNSFDDLYPIATRPPTTTLPPSTFTVLSTQLWHNRLGHPGATILRSLHRDNFLQCNKSRNNFFYNSCPLGKQTKFPFYSSLSHTFMPFDTVHSDLWTSPVLSSEGHRYYVLFLDDYTNFLWIFPIHTKSQVYSIFLQFRTHNETQFERKIKYFQCDNGKEYDNSQFHKFCEQNGMPFRFSCPHTSPTKWKSRKKNSYPK